MKTLVDQKTNLEVYTVSNQKPVKIVTNGQNDTRKRATRKRRELSYVFEDCRSSLVPLGRLASAPALQHHIWESLISK